MDKLSIIIPVFNRWLFTEGALKDLSFLDKSMHQIIVVDNGSTDQTALEMNKWTKLMSNIKYLKLPENLGFGKACNKGFQTATGNIIMFLNNDIRVSSGRHAGTWTDHFINELHDNPNQLLAPTAGLIDQKKNFQFVYETSEPQKEWNYLSGWMLVGTKDNFKKLILKDQSGPFNEKFFAYYEDTDLSFRARELSIPLKLFPYENVVHLGRITSRQLNHSQLYNESKTIFCNIWKDKIK